MADEAEEFQVEDIEQIVKTSLQSSISQESRYSPESADSVSRTLLEACIKNLAALSKPYKYVVTAIIMQKNGAGLHTAMGAYWDARKDGTAKISWENETMHIVVTVYGVAISPSSQEKD